MGEPEFSEPRSKNPRAPGGAATPPDTNEQAQKDEKQTEAGQEARRGVPPGNHDREHQSDYGGGGPNGGA